MSSGNGRHCVDYGFDRRGARHNHRVHSRWSRPTLTRTDITPGDLDLRPSVRSRLRACSCLSSSAWTAHAHSTGFADARCARASAMTRRRDSMRLMEKPLAATLRRARHSGARSAQSARCGRTIDGRGATRRRAFEAIAPTAPASEVADALGALVPASIFVQAGAADHVDTVSLGVIWPLPWQRDVSFGRLATSIEASLGQWADAWPAPRHPSVRAVRLHAVAPLLSRCIGRELVRLRSRHRRQRDRTRVPHRRASASRPHSTSATTWPSDVSSAPATVRDCASRRALLECRHRSPEPRRELRAAALGRAVLTAGARRSRPTRQLDARLGLPKARQRAHDADREVASSSGCFPGAASHIAVNERKPSTPLRPNSQAGGAADAAPRREASTSEDGSAPALRPGAWRVRPSRSSSAAPFRCPKARPSTSFRWRRWS